MSTLRSALDKFAHDDVRRAADATLEDDLDELGRAAARIDVERSVTRA